MRVAAFYDIHGNLPALEAVLEEMRHEQVEQVVVGGDVLSGPMQVECLDRLRALPIPVHYINGNTDREVLATLHGDENRSLPPFALQMLRWSADQITPELAEWIASWPKTLTLEVASLGRVLFCHATPRDDNETFTVLTDERRMLPIFDAAHADVVVCGHTHMQFDRMLGQTRVLKCEQHLFPLQAIRSVSMNSEGVVLQPCTSTNPTMRPGTY
jgi:predicted phosphodiesterase